MNRAFAANRHDASFQSKRGASSTTFRTGRLLTVDRPAATAAEKADLRSKHSADFVDMESSAVAAFCAERGIRFLSVRVITDTASEELPRWLHRLTARPSNAYRAGAALRVLWDKPANANDLLKLRNIRAIPVGFLRDLAQNH